MSINYIRQLMCSACLLLSIFVFSQNDTLAPKIPGYHEGDFEDLITSNRLQNFKSGLVSTAIRGDTIFAIFYLKTLNRLKCVPLGSLSLDEKFVLSESYNLPFFERLRETNGILISRVVSIDQLEGADLIVIEQVLSSHIIVNSSEFNQATLPRRVLYYDRENGCSYIQSIVKLDDTDSFFVWPYKRGDFLFE